MHKLDEIALREAILLSKRQPRCDAIIPWLTPTGFTVPTDLIPIYRNGATLSAPVSALPIAAINPPYFFNVMTFGATGNGVTDDTAFIAAAIAAAQAAGGGIVYFPQGHYLRSQVWNITANGITLMGAGPGASFITSVSGATLPPTVVETSSGVSYTRIQDLAFIGNGTTVSTPPPPNAPSVIQFNGGTHNNVHNCYFTANTGDTIDFLGVVTGEVTFCRFFDVGYHGSVALETVFTPGVYIDTASVDVRVYRCHFELCQYHGVWVLGTNCDVSENYGVNNYGAGIRVGSDNTYGYGSGLRMVGNQFTVTHVAVTGHGGGTGCYVSNTFGVTAVANHFNTNDNDGMSFAGCQYSVVAYNIAMNNCQLGGGGGDSGIQINPNALNNTNNEGMVIVGNVSADSQGSPTQPNGIRILGSNSGVLKNSVLANNAFFGNTNRGIYATDAVLDDDSNSIRANSDWMDLVHLGAPYQVPLNTTLVTDVGAPLASVAFQTIIPQASMGLQRGFRITASGTTGTNVTGNYVFFLSLGGSGLGALGNLFQLTLDAASGADWFFTCELFGVASNSAQRGWYSFYYNGALSRGLISTAVMTNTTAPPLTLQVQTPNQAGGTVTVQTATYERL